MRKLTKLFMFAVIALGLSFAACNNDDVPQGGDQQEGNTNVSVALKLGAGSTRALPNDYNDIGEWAGSDEIKTITIYVSDFTSVIQKNFVIGSDYELVTKGSNQFLNPLEPAAIKTTAGLKRVYVLINARQQALDILTPTLGSSGAFETAYASVLALENSGTAVEVSTSASKIAEVSGGKDAIMMTNVEPQDINVAPNVNQEQTIAGDNRVSMEVERAVARVMVTTAKTSYDVPSADGSTTIGTISNVTWVLAQGENSLYIQRKENWNTPNFDWVPSSDANYWGEAGDKYDYSGLYEKKYGAGSTLYGGTDVPTLTDYALADKDYVGENSILDGKFVLATTHEVADGEASSFKKGNTVYAMVRAQFVPTTFADEGTYTAGEDFYLGANGKFYKSAEAAADPSGTGVTQTVTRYVGGKVIYYAWANPDDIPAWYNSPVLRNNIYHIHITGFKTIGTNWNPLFPEDPDNPNMIPNPGFDPEKPEGPDNPKEIPSNPDPKPGIDPNWPDCEGEDCPEYPEEPVNPIDPEDPLTTPETYMSVDVSILPWKVHSYDIDLGI